MKGYLILCACIFSFLFGFHTVTHSNCYLFLGYVYRKDHKTISLEANYVLILAQATKPTKDSCCLQASTSLHREHKASQNHRPEVVTLSKASVRNCTASSMPADPFPLSLSLSLAMELMRWLESVGTYQEYGCPCI